MTANVYSRALLRAAELVGGRDKLARLLRAPKSDIDKWIAGDAKPPRDIFLRVVDVILDETAGESDDTPEPPPRDAAAGSSRYTD